MNQISFSKSRTNLVSKIGCRKSKSDTVSARFSSRIKSKAVKMDEATLNLQQHSVYVGGAGGYQNRAFRVAASRFAGKINFNYINLEDVKCSTWNEERFVRQLWDKMDAHYVITNLPQGLIYEMEGWNSKRLIDIFQRDMYHHPGYPAQLQLGDNTLHQRKHKTIAQLGNLAIPSLQINFCAVLPHTLSPTIMVAIHAFAAANWEESGGKFTVKMPHSTNSAMVHNDLTLEEAMAKIIFYQMEYGEEAECCILQPTLRNKKEYKLLFTENGFSHMCHNHVKAKGLAFATDQQLLLFAEAVMSRLKQDPTFLCGPFVRIDIMCTSNQGYNAWGGFVCNEIESLEAMTAALGRYGGGTKDGEMEQHLESFWTNYIQLTYDHVFQTTTDYYFPTPSGYFT